MTTPVGSTGSTTPTTPPKMVTITQPDGSSFQIPQTTATWDPATKTWKSEVTPEMTAQATQINRKYGMALDADDFMKLLVAQMRFQDPSKPADTTAMMQQTASMAMLERVNEMTDSAKAMADAAKGLTASNDQLMARYAAQATEQRMSTAVGLIGAAVTYPDPANASQALTGLVDSVKFSTDGPILTVNGKDVPLGSITAVTAPAHQTTAPTPTTGTTAPAPSTDPSTTTATDGTSAQTSATDSPGTTGSAA